MTNTEAVLQENICSFFNKAVCPASRLLPSLLPWTPACPWPCEESIPWPSCSIIHSTYLDYITAAYVWQLKFRVSSCSLLPPPPSSSPCILFSPQLLFLFFSFGARDETWWLVVLKKSPTTEMRPQLWWPGFLTCSLVSFTLLHLQGSLLSMALWESLYI